MSDETPVAENTIEEEREKVCNVVRRIGPRLSGLMIVSGIIVFLFGVYLLAVSPDPVMSARLQLVFTSALGFIGVLNITCGLLLLLGED